MTKRQVEVIGVMSGTFFLWDTTVTIISAALNKKCVLKLVMVFGECPEEQKEWGGRERLGGGGNFTALAFLSVQ